MRRTIARISVLAVLLGSLPVGFGAQPVYAAGEVTVEPGVTVEAVIEPISGTGPQMVNRTFKIRNYNLDEDTDYGLGCVYRRGTVGPVDVEATYTDSEPGARNGVEIEALIPAHWSLVDNSVFLDGSLIAPAMTTNGYEVPMDLPAADGGPYLRTLIDQVEFVPPTP